MKTVMILCPSISGIGGVEKVVINLANELCKCSNVIIGTLRLPKPSYEIDERVKCVFMKECRYRKIGVLSHIIRKKIKLGKIDLNDKVVERIYYPHYRINKFYNYIKKNDVDDIIGVGVDMTLVASHMKKKNNNIRVIGWQHNEFRVYFETPGKYYYGLLGVFKNNSDYIDENVVLTIKEKLLFDNKVDKESKCISNPLCINYKEEVLNNWEKNNILFVGRIAKKQKGIDFLIEILKEIFEKEEAKKWTVTIVGDGQDRNYLEEEIHKKGLNNYVKVIGGVNDVSPYYKESSILLSTSRWEGFGLVIIEALYYGLNVVAFDNEGPSEIIENGYNGILIPKYNLQEFVERVQELMLDNDTRKKISKQAKITSEKYMPYNIVKKWIGLI